MVILCTRLALLTTGTLLLLSFCSASVLPTISLEGKVSSALADPAARFFSNGLPALRKAALDETQEEEEENPTEDEEEDIVVYKSKQPSTPPDSLASDPYARYKYQELLPKDFQGSRTRRTIIVGDIHASLDGFEGFLSQIGFDSAKDSLILAGDLVAKGSQSLPVIDKARSLNARCVRGNHDDKVIRWKGYLDSLSGSEKSRLENDARMRPMVTDDENSPEYDADQPSVRPLAQMRDIPSDLVENSEHHLIAKNMNQEQYQYLISCPLVLTLPAQLSIHKVPVHVVHAGIDPRRDLLKQMPWVLVNVRNILKDGTPSRKKKKGNGWAQEFNDLHNRRSPNKEDFLLVYGHDAGRSLNVKKWSIGLDTGCVYGRALSGYVVETGQIYTVPCPASGVDGDDE